MMETWTALVQYVCIDFLTFSIHVARFHYLNDSDDTKLMKMSNHDLRKAHGGGAFSRMDESILPKDDMFDVQKAWHALAFMNESMTMTVNLLVVGLSFVVLRFTDETPL